MRKGLLALGAAILGALVVQAAQELHYTLISPPAYTADWQAYLDMRAEQRPDVAFDLVNAADVYAAHPFDPAATDGAPRNPAESIHAWIRARMRGIADPTERAKHYFVLGGSFVDAQTVTAADDVRLQKYIPGVYVRPRFSPDANIQVGEPYYSISDMFYACLDVRDGEWPWDANKNGKYADNQEAGTTLNDYVADVVVARIPVEKHPSGAKAVIVAFKEKVARVEDPAFAGSYRFALAGGQCSNKDGRINVSDSRTLRDEHEFYDGGLNMFDPRHGGMWIDSELVPRQTVKNTTAMKRPVLEGNPMFVYGWGADHSSIDAAVSHFYSHDYDYLEYRDHGSASDLYCKYINADAYLKATGLTRMIVSGFSCMTGYIDGPGVSLAEAEILSPRGGTVASVHNSRYGVNYVGTDLKDNAGLSSSLQYLIKQGVLEKDMDLGQAWLCARQKFVASDGLGLFVSMEQLLLGDPLIRLPPAVPEVTIEDSEINVCDEAGYTTLNLAGLDPVISGEGLFKVMQRLNAMSGHALTFAVDGGVGGKGIDFKNGEGTLKIVSPTKSYFVQPTGAGHVVLAGSGTTLDFDTAEPSFARLTLRGEGEARRTGNVLRGRKVGQLKGFLPLAIENTEVALGTVDAFSGATSEMFATVANGGLGIAFNPNYGLDDSWEYLSKPIALANGTLFVDRTTTAGFGRPDKSGLAVDVSGESFVKTLNGGKITLFGTTTLSLAADAELVLSATFVPDAATSGRLVLSGGTTIVDGQTGLAGEVEVTAGTLDLRAIPLLNVTKLTLGPDVKLVLPKDEGGFYQILQPTGATLELNGATIYASDDRETPMSGELTATCAYFDTTAFLVWNRKGGGTWDAAADNRPWRLGGDSAAYASGMKVYFPDIPMALAGQVHAITLPEEINCDFANFGNRDQRYAFAGARLNLKNLLVGTEIAFANTVYSSAGARVTGGKLTVANLNTPSVEIAKGATVSAEMLASDLSMIRGFRFVPLDTAQSGGGKLSVSELEFSTANGKIKLGQATVSEPTGLGAISTNLSKAWDGDVLGMNFSFNGQQPWSVAFADSSVMAGGEYYLQFLFESPIPMLTGYRVGAAFSNQKVESAKAWRIDVTVDGESWVTVSRVSEVSYPGAGFGELWVNSGNSFRVEAALSKTAVAVAKGGVYELKGRPIASFALEAGAVLKAVPGAALAYTAETVFAYPTEGTVVIDASGLALSTGASQLVVANDGKTFSVEDLAHFAVTSGHYLSVDDAGLWVVNRGAVPPKVLFK